MAQRYDTYKDSGVQWLGEIPEHWGCVPVRRIAYVNPTRTKKLEEDSYVGYAPMERIRCDNMNPSNIKVSKLTSGLTYCEEGDIVLAKVTPCFENGNLAIVPHVEQGCCYASSELFVFRVKDKIISRFLLYTFLNRGFINAGASTMRGTGGLKRVTTEFANSAATPLPPLPEQQTIVSYLDSKCSKIDEWIEKKQKEVELLQEMKQRVIADAVTRGLNPNVKMKQTNIPWLPEVPEHWDCIRLSNCILSSVVGSWGVDEKKDGTDILCLRVADFDYNKGVIKKDRLTYRNYEGKLTDNKLLKNGDLLLEKSGGGDIYPVGRVVRYSLDGIIATCSNFIQKLTPNLEIVSSDYLYFWFKMVYSLKVNGMYFNQTTGIQNLKVNEYLKQIIYLPILSEQHAIVAYINERTAKIDKMVENVNREIENLKEYKQRLISDVVTGQIKVC